MGHKKMDINYIKNIMKQDGYILLSEEYKNNKAKLKIKCPNGHEYTADWRAYNQGERCPHCILSKGEKKVENILKEKGIRYICQYKIKDCKDKDCLPFDFYLPDFNILIEYDGQQHFKPMDFAGKGEEWAIKNMFETQRRDNIKTQYCKDNNIKLIRIPYFEFENIEQIFIDNSLF